MKTFEAFEVILQHRLRWPCTEKPWISSPDTRRQARFLETDEQAISCFSRCLRANEEALLLFTLLYRATGRLVTVHGAIGFDRGIEENKAFTREGLQ